MPPEERDTDLWSQLAVSGAPAPTEDVFAGGYVRHDDRAMTRYAVFRVGPEWYALSIDCIEEISKLFDTTLVPKTAPFVVGIGNVRGRIVPVVDLATRLGLPSHVRGSESRMLIVRHDDESYALVVDEVEQVVSLPADAFEAVPETMPAGRQRFLDKLVRSGDRLLIVLDLSTLLAPEEFVLGGAEEGRR